MPTGEIRRAKVAYIITIRGVVDSDYEHGVETPDVALYEEMTKKGLVMSRSVAELMHESDDVDIDFRTDDTRNYPPKLGGHYMGESRPSVVCDCGRTDFDSDGCCAGCGQHASEIGS